MIKQNNKQVTKIKEVKDMTKKELLQELEGIQSHIELFSYGRWELNYRNELEQELGKRGVI